MVKIIKLVLILTMFSSCKNWHMGKEINTHKIEKKHLKQLRCPKI